MYGALCILLLVCLIAITIIVYITKKVCDSTVTGLDDEYVKRILRLATIGLGTGCLSASSLYIGVKSYLLLFCYVQLIITK